MRHATKRWIQRRMRPRWALLAMFWLFLSVSCEAPSAQTAEGWARKRIPGPNMGKQQTACVVLDVDGDDVDDFVVTERTKTPSVVWYKYNGTTWDRRVIDNTRLRPEAGGDVCDIDGDGDLDLIFGQDGSGNQMWWWENPNPNFDKPWVRRLIKSDGPSKHHDQSVADYDGDGAVELVTWNQRAKALLLYEIPADPKGTEPWPSTVIYTWKAGPELEGFPSRPVDVNGDGKVDIVGGGRWFEHKGGTAFEAHVIDDEMRFTQCAAGQLVAGGRPEIVFSPGDMDGVAKWYQWEGGKWISHDLRHVKHGHTCEVRDIDGDGKLDIMIGEMGNPGAGDEADTWIWYGDGRGGLRETVVSHGQGTHEGLLGDFDGDGDLDILLKPYNHNTPRIDILLNEGGRKAAFGAWERHGIDTLPDRAMFVQAGDLDGDGRKDLIAGGWWWKNPGGLDGRWPRHTIGSPLQNTTTVFDFDGDGDLDIIGTQGVGSQKNNDHVWARNNGKGRFEIHQNIRTGGDGDFLQGRVAADFGAGVQVVLSWHNGGGGVQALTVPGDVVKTPWAFSILSTKTLKEDLSAGDIDRDGDRDLLLGDTWLRNDRGTWKAFSLGQVTRGEADRNDLADVNGDGRLDAIVSLERGTDVLWFEAPPDPTKPWTRHKIGSVAGQGFSMDTADLDRDGDPDVAIGEHRGKTHNRVVVFENAKDGASWSEHVIDRGPTDEIDHHNGTQAVDLDGDGDLDLISIGWHNPKLWVYEHK